jgi:hypothetical protein
MPREGTRSATGNSKPRVFPTVDTAPAVKRTTAKPKTVKKPAPAAKAKAAKPTGVTKKKAAPKKESGVAKKVLYGPPKLGRGNGAISRYIRDLYRPWRSHTRAVLANFVSRSRLP